MAFRIPRCDPSGGGYFVCIKVTSASDESVVTSLPENAPEPPSVCSQGLLLCPRGGTGTHTPSGETDFAYYATCIKITLQVV
jgi:hypothetical protein